MGVSSRTGVAAAVLLTGLLLFYTAFISAPAFAQDDDPNPVVSGDGNNNQEDDQECPVPEEVNTTTGSGDEQSSVFDITGQSFRVTIDVAPTSEDPDLAGVTVFVNTEDDDSVTRIAKEGEGTEASIVNAGEDSFFLDILAANADYEITVEDCTGDTGDGGDNDDSNDNNNGNDDVIDGTIPDKDLPDTGGFSVLVAGGMSLLLLSGSLVAWRLKTRER